MMCGGAAPPVEVDDEVKALCEQIRADLEMKVERSFDVYEPILVSRQVVAGTNHFVKIHVGNEVYVHVRVFQPLPCYGTTPELHGYQVDMTKDDLIGYFE